jgi:hypothetical protein
MNVRSGFLPSRDSDVGALQATSSNAAQKIMRMFIVRNVFLEWPRSENAEQILHRIGGPEQ